MRLLLSAALAASVSFAAALPAQACISACSSSGPSSPSVSSTTGGSSSSGPSDAHNHGLPGHGQSTSIEVFIEGTAWNHQSLNTLEEAIERLKQVREARQDFRNSLESLEANSFAGLPVWNIFLLHVGYERRGAEANATENFIISRWGADGRNAIANI